MNLTFFDELLMALGLGGQLLLCVVLLRSRLYRSFPIFFTYIVYSSISDIGYLLILRNAPSEVYRLTYFASNVPEFLLQIGTLFEVSRNVLNPVKRSLPRPAVWVYAGMLAIGTLTAVLLSMHSQPQNLDRWSQYFVHLALAVAILRVAIFSAIAIFSQFFGIGWKNHVLQIATGFLVYSIAGLLVQLWQHFTGFTNDSLYHLQEQFRIIGWCMVLGYWSYALSRLEAPRREFSPRMAELLESFAVVSRSYRSLSLRAYRK